MASILKKHAKNYSLLHCVTQYPTPLDQMHLNRLNWLRASPQKLDFQIIRVIRDGTLLWLPQEWGYIS